MEFGQRVILNDLLMICAKEQNPVNVGHMFGRARPSQWVLFEWFGKKWVMVWKEENIFKQASNPIY